MHSAKRTRFVIIAACTTVALAIIATGAAAQTVPEGQSCGGLLCDLGVFGHKTEPTAAPPPSTVSAEAAPSSPVTLPTAVSPTLPAPRKKVAHKKPAAAKVVAGPAAPAATPVAVRPVAAAEPARAPARTVQSATPSPLFTPPRPAPYLFQPIYQ